MGALWCIVFISKRRNDMNRALEAFLALTIHFGAPALILWLL